VHIVERLERVEDFYGKTGLTIGNFEGYHRGHREIVGRLVSESRARGLHPAVITFKRHPLAVLAGKEPERLWSPSDKIIRMRDEGISLLVYIDFSPEFAGMSPVDFLEMLGETLGPKLLCLGSNFKFGRENKGNIGFLASVSSRYGFELIAVDDLRHRGRPISSTRIREAVKAGDFPLVTELLGRMYSVRLVPEKDGGKSLVPAGGGCALPRDGTYTGELEDLGGTGGSAPAERVRMAIRGGCFRPEREIKLSPEGFYRFFFDAAAKK
jgi:riboflavin kinase / FMN adenylyltransferase